MSIVLYEGNIMNKKLQDIVIYQTKDKKIEVSLEKETIWLSLNQISELFDKDKSVISRHLRNIFKSGELNKDSTVANFATVQTEVRRKIKRAAKTQLVNLITQMISLENV